MAKTAADWLRFARMHATAESERSQRFWLATQLAELDYNFEEMVKDRVHLESHIEHLYQKIAKLRPEHGQDADEARSAT